MRFTTIIVLFLLAGCAPLRYSGLPTHTVTSGAADYKVKLKPSSAGFDVWSCWEGYVWGIHKDLLKARQEASAAAVAAVDGQCVSPRVEDVIRGEYESGSPHCFDVLIVCDG